MIDFAMNIDNEFSETYNTNLLHIRNLDLGQVKLVHGNQTLVNLKTEIHVRAYAETMKALSLMITVLTFSIRILKIIFILSGF